MCRRHHNFIPNKSKKVKKKLLCNQEVVFLYRFIRELYPETTENDEAEMKTLEFQHKFKVDDLLLFIVSCFLLYNTSAEHLKVKEEI